MIAWKVFWTAFNAALCACFEMLGSVLGVVFATAFICLLIVGFLYLMNAALNSDGAVA